MSERLNNAAEGCLSLGYGTDLYTLLKEAARSAIEPLRVIRDCVRIDPPGDFIVMFGDAHDREDVKLKWDEALRAAADDRAKEKA